MYLLPTKSEHPSLHQKELNPPEHAHILERMWMFMKTHHLPDLLQTNSSHNGTVRALRFKLQDFFSIYELLGTILSMYCFSIYYFGSSACPLRITITLFLQISGCINSGNTKSCISLRHYMFLGKIIQPLPHVSLHSPCWCQENGWRKPLKCDRVCSLGLHQPAGAALCGFF